MGETMESFKCNEFCEECQAGLDCTSGVIELMVVESGCI
jgi:hypothetical protein